ncbi:MAG TPA: MerR family transcriptional regulator [Solirubrobacterales bacterium]|nr:MerR family transcriptional regulator [Solirubrobacterales bacterium]
MAPGIRTNAAAEMLGVSPNTLRSWERRFGYPEPERSIGNHRQYNLVELQTLREALDETGSIGTAIEVARQRQEVPVAGQGLEAALRGFDEAGADRAMEESLAIRPVERTIEEMLLPALDGLAQSAEAGDPAADAGPAADAPAGTDAELEFACRWAMGWLHGARRMAAAASRPAGVLLLDSTTGRDLEAVYAQALDLALRRAGFRVLALSSLLADRRLESAVSALDPTAIIFCGPREGRAEDLLRRVREAGADAPVYTFRDDSGDETIAPAGNTPSEVTAMLNSDLRRNL